MAEIAQVAPLTLTGWEGDEPLRAWLPGHWRKLSQTGRWRRLFRDLAWYVTNEKGPPPLGLRTSLVRLRRRLRPDTLPDWLDTDFARRTDLAARLAEHRYAQSRAYYTGSRAKYIESVPWAGIFDGYDIGWTGRLLETTYPLMDPRVLPWLARVPAIPWCLGKRLFRCAARTMLPDTVVRRPKIPLSGDPAQKAFQRKLIYLPSDIRTCAEGSDYVVSERIFDSNGAIRADRPLEIISPAVLFVSWLGMAQRDNFHGIAKARDQIALSHNSCGDYVVDLQRSSEGMIQD